jgi:hypothetical protein
MVVTPPAPGDAILELDLVQELVCWFGDKGSPTLRVATTVHDVPTTATPPPPVHPPPARPLPRTAWRASFVESLLQPLRRPAAPFEMHAVPRERVEAAIGGAGGLLIRAIEDDACGAGWRSFTYVCRRPR